MDLVVFFAGFSQVQRDGSDLEHFLGIFAICFKNHGLKTARKKNGLETHFLEISSQNLHDAEEII